MANLDITSVGGLTLTTGAAKTAGYTLVAGELGRYNASGGTFTIQLPTSPNHDDQAGIVENDGDATTITVDGDSNTVIGSSGSSDTTSTEGGEFVVLVWKYSADESTWFLVADASVAGVPLAHAASHENGGSDEINVTDLSGVLADAQNPAAHSHTHASTTGKTADDHHAESHTVASHSDTTATGAQLNTLTGAGNADALHAHAHSATTGQGADDHHAQLHAASHSDGGSDKITVENLATSSTNISRALKPDGSGGLAFVATLDAQPGTFSTGIKFYADIGNSASYEAGQSTTLRDVAGGAVGTIADTNLADGRLNFDGADSLVNFDAVSADVAGLFDSIDGYVEVWCFIKSDGEGNLGVLVDAGYGADGKNWIFNVSDESGGFVKLSLTAAWTTTDGIWTTTDASVPINTRVCLSFQYNNDSVSENPTFYKNGVSLGAVTEDQTPDGTPDTDTVEDLVIGNRADASATFDGWIEVVTMWSTTIVSSAFRLSSYQAKAARFGHYTGAFITDFAEANQANGLGAVNTLIFRFTTRGDSPDGNISWTDDADDGTYATINTGRAGTYRITLNGTNTGIGDDSWAVCSAGALSNTFLAAHIKAIQEVGAGDPGSLSCDIPLAANQLVWVMREGSSSMSTTAYLSRFTILKISDVGP